MRFAALAVGIVLLLTGCVWDLERRGAEEIIDHYTEKTFYELPADVPAGEPGEIIRAMPILSAPTGSRAWRVIYHSTDLAGEDVPVSGVVVVPDVPAPSEGRTVVSWAHPTTGSAQHCGPSLGIDPFILITGLEQFLLEGYAVVATDYQGMSLAGDSSYLIGVTEGHNVLDAVRAAQNLPETGVGEKTLLWGHSQGGQAALFAAQLAADYAPELDFEAVAVAAPAANLNALMSRDIVDVSGVSIASYAIPAMTVAYADRYSVEELHAILTPEGLEAMPKIAALCLLSENSQVHAIADPLVGNFVTSDPATTEPWATILRENSAGASRIGVPIYIGQGLADALVIPSATAAYATSLCSGGETVQFDEFRDVDHGFAALVALDSVIDFFAAVAQGSARGNCA